ncbi:Calpain-1 catalytic subunit [Seminavis robusta]|uniref:Calpain-1 catalytic subunit n=1 Tax=Seminavis robusta TaxID=568900 RepID=A0A9N8EBI1_9STRA|nr:Calpain-1 catalytic subunit [Seminavis robusta]|eukprot:Sro904_g218360.1 Calpain-1 catalytic subunit (839) ;mRNA; f:11400-14112
MKIPVTRKPARSLSPMAVKQADKMLQDRISAYEKKKEARLTEKERELKRKEEERKRRDEEWKKSHNVKKELAPANVVSQVPSHKKPARAARSLSPTRAAPIKKNVGEARQDAAALGAAARARAKQDEAERKIRVEKENRVKAQTHTAHQKVVTARMNRWKELQVKRLAEAAKRAKAFGHGPPPERVPKMSALLAMGGPEAEDYKKKQEAAKLAVWKSHLRDKWEIVRTSFDGMSSFEEKKEIKINTFTTDEEAIQEFKHNPEKYLAMHFHPLQPEPKDYHFILRPGTVGYQPLDVKNDGTGQRVIWRHIYRRLKPFPDNLLPVRSCDKYTDNMTFLHRKLHSTSSKRMPLLPGRGMGLGDEANMDMIGAQGAFPDHVRQGACVGDCWLLSAIACLADFDWAIQRLFRKSKPGTIKDKPTDEPNQYTVTLWDLKTWKEVDIVVDERLPVRDDGTGYLLGAKPSKDGKFWVCYLEKAVAMHCGGYDKIVGGNPTDAWPMLTGSRNQFVIQKVRGTSKYWCGAKYNPEDQKWSPHSNSPHDSSSMLWKVSWPKAGGGGDGDLTEDELFQRIITWDEHNFLIGAATAGTSDRNTTDGIVDNHAYSIIDSRQNICGTGIDLLLIRNPWGEGGELQNGQFMRSGPGWGKYPNIKNELNPSLEDNGLCWVTKQEFFRYFPSVYVCTLNMTRIKDSNYVNDLEDDFVKKPKATAPKPKPKPAPVSPKKKTIIRHAPQQEKWSPHAIDTSSDPNSTHKIVVTTFNGGYSFSDINKKDVAGTAIQKGVDEFRANPDKYVSMVYQNSMVEEGWPVDKHRYTLFLRAGTEDLDVNAAPGGKKTLLTNVRR